MKSELSDFYQGKKVLVTGHTGFKGSWLTEWLLMMGAKVTGLALPPPTDPALFDQLGLAGRCDHRIGDIRDRAMVRQVVHEVRPDVIFHLAAQPLVRLSYTEPLETYETNVMGTAHVLDALRDADWPCAAVMVTTDKVYENKEWLYAYRENDPLGGYDPYSSSKACAELVIQSYRNSFFNPEKIEAMLKSRSDNQCVTHLASSVSDRASPDFLPLVGVASARAGNVIGGGDWAADRIVPDAMRAVARGGVVRVRHPNASRPWQHVLDPLSGYLLLGMKLYRGLTMDPMRIAMFASSFNFGPLVTSNQPVRVLVDELLKHWPGRWVALTSESSFHESSRLNLSIDKAVHLLGWRPAIDFAKAVEAVVEVYRSCHEGGVASQCDGIRAQINNYMTRLIPGEANQA